MRKEEKNNKTETPEMILEILVTAFIIVVLAALMIKVIFY
jgi:hypothetical protein